MVRLEIQADKFGIMQQAKRTVLKIKTHAENVTSTLFAAFMLLFEQHYKQMSLNIYPFLRVNFKILPLTRLIKKFQKIQEILVQSIMLSMVQDYHNGMEMKLFLPKYSVHLCFILAVVSHVCEAAIYATIWIFLQQHNKRMAPHLSKQAMRQRMKTSAVSIGCDMYFFTYETIWILIMCLVNLYGSERLFHWVFLAWQFHFPIRNHFQAMSTESTRRIYLENLIWIQNVVTRPFKMIKSPIRILQRLLQ